MSSASLQAFQRYLVLLMFDEGQGQQASNFCQAVTNVCLAWAYLPPATVRESGVPFRLEFSDASAKAGCPVATGEAALPGRSFADFCKDMKNDRTLALGLALEIVQLAKKEGFEAVTADTQTLETVFRILTRSPMPAARPAPVASPRTPGL